MSGEIRDWLADLSAGEPRTAAAIVHALTALADTGPDLGPPMVVPLDKPPRSADPTQALDYAYQEWLDRLHHLRRTAADPGELIALQADADAFRVRKEVLKARYTAAAVEESVARFYADVAAGNGDDEALAENNRVIADRAKTIKTVTGEIERDLGREPWPAGLYELRPGVPADDVRLIFALEPPGAVLLLSVLEGPDAVDQQHDEAVTVSAEILIQVRAGEDAEASAVEFADGRELADEFAADDGDVRS